MASTTSPPAKKPKFDPSLPTLGTHNGTFHADEALAIFLLRTLPQYAHSNLIRTRDPALLQTCTVVVDVGGEYDASRLRFDHHQRGFSQVFPGRETKLSAAGLVWLHLGKDVVRAVTGHEGEEEVEILWRKLYTSFVEAFDGNDNGIDAHPEPERARFETGGFTLAGAVARLNWHDVDASTWLPLPLPARGAEVSSGQDVEDARFAKASALVGAQLTLALLDLHAAWLPARNVVRACYANRFVVHTSGRIMALPHRDGGLPWMEHLYACETDPSLNAPSASSSSSSPSAADDDAILYVLFPESAAPDSKWRVRAVSESRSSFKNRRDLPDAWKGLRDDELSRVAGIPGCVFVHAAGFIGGNVSEKGALEMAIRALD